MMMFKYHVPVKTERAVAVACSELLDIDFLLMRNIVNFLLCALGNTLNLPG